MTVCFGGNRKTGKGQTQQKKPYHLDSKSPQVSRIFSAHSLETSPEPLSNGSSLSRRTQKKTTKKNIYLLRFPSVRAHTQTPSLDHGEHQQTCTRRPNRYRICPKPAIITRLHDLVGYENNSSYLYIKIEHILEWEIYGTNKTGRRLVTFT